MGTTHTNGFLPAGTYADAATNLNEDVHFEMLAQQIESALRRNRPAPDCVTGRTNVLNGSVTKTKVLNGSMTSGLQFQYLQEYESALSESGDAALAAQTANKMLRQSSNHCEEAYSTFLLAKNLGHIDSQLSEPLTASVHQHLAGCDTEVCAELILACQNDAGPEHPTVRFVRSQQQRKRHLRNIEQVNALSDSNRMSEARTWFVQTENDIATSDMDEPARLDVEANLAVTRSGIELHDFADERQLHRTCERAVRKSRMVNEPALLGTALLRSSLAQFMSGAISQPIITLRSMLSDRPDLTDPFSVELSLDLAWMCANVGELAEADHLTDRSAPHTTGRLRSKLMTVSAYIKVQQNEHQDASEQLDRCSYRQAPLAQFAIVRAYTNAHLHGLPHAAHHLERTQKRRWPFNAANIEQMAVVHAHLIATHQCAKAAAELLDSRRNVGPLPGVLQPWKAHLLCASIYQQAQRHSESNFHANLAVTYLNVAIADMKETQQSQFLTYVTQQHDVTFRTAAAGPLDQLTFGG